MKTFLCIVLCLITLSGCSLLSPEIKDIPTGYGELTYESIIGQTWYSNQSLAPLFAEPTLFYTSSVEQWKFYRDSIVVIATHYDSETMMALDQWKFIADIRSIDDMWADEDGDPWRTTATIWESQVRSGHCNWTDIYSFTSPPVNIQIEKNPEERNNIAIGCYELLKYYPLTMTPLDIWYPENWIGTICGFIL